MNKKNISQWNHNHPGTKITFKEKCDFIEISMEIPNTKKYIHTCPYIKNVIGCITMKTKAKCSLTDEEIIKILDYMYVDGLAMFCNDIY